MFDPMFKDCVDVYQVPFFEMMITKFNMMKLYVSRVARKYD